VTRARLRQRRELLDWYRPRRSTYPWRRTADPYAILVSEVMLQQTQAERVAPAFGRFVSAYPTVGALAAASPSDVIREWAGLGYNRRAVALWSAARVIVERHGGAVPSDPSILRTLPGVGGYTSAAVASIGFGVRAPAIDTNVARVVSRVFRVEGEAAVRAAAAGWLDGDDPGGWNQAVMDLGRIVCRPRPRCGQCPIRPTCRSAGLEPVPVDRPRARPFDGSARQLRGQVIAVLRTRRSATLGSLAAGLGRGVDLVSEAVRSLDADGLLVAGPAALSGRPSGRVRLP
jgi:A/G-specific adenine glycosylase